MRTRTSRTLARLTGSALALLCMLTALLAAPRIALARVNESEPNNSFSTADAIPANTWVYGTADNGTSADYYKVVLPAKGTMTFYFKSTKVYESANTHGVLVYDRDHECVASGNFGQNTTKADYIIPTELPKGTYYVEVDDGHLPLANHPYAFKVRYTYKGAKISRLTAGSAQFKAQWNRVNGATKYQLRYSTNKTMRGATTITCSRGTVTKTISGSHKKTYYVQVRVAKKAGGKTYWSDWSSRKRVTTR